MWVRSQFSALWADQDSMACSPLQLEEELAFFLNKYIFSIYLLALMDSLGLYIWSLITAINSYQA